MSALEFLAAKGGFYTAMEISVATRIPLPEITTELDAALNAGDVERREWRAAAIVGRTYNSVPRVGPMELVEQWRVAG